MAANPKETTAIIRENAADHALRPLFMRFEWTRCLCSYVQIVVFLVTLLIFLYLQNWIGYGFDVVDRERDAFIANFTMFIYVTIAFCGFFFTMIYMPDIR